MVEYGVGGGVWSTCPATVQRTFMARSPAGTRNAIGAQIVTFSILHVHSNLDKPVYSDGVENRKAAVPPSRAHACRSWALVRHAFVGPVRARKMRRPPSRGPNRRWSRRSATSVPTALRYGLPHARCPQYRPRPRPSDATPSPRSPHVPRVGDTMLTPCPPRFRLPRGWHTGR